MSERPTDQNPLHLIGNDGHSPWVHWQGSSELLEEKGVLLCPLCKRAYSEGQIFQCHDGHLFCKLCSNGQKQCPNSSCSRQLYPRGIRNRMLETIVRTTPLLSLTKVASEVVREEDSSGVSSSGTCRICADELHLSSVRYKCLTCRNYTLCENCVDSGYHDQHQTLRIINAKTEAAAEELIALAK